MRMKSATLFAIGFLSVGFWPPDGARCQTSIAPPLSLTRPTPSPDVDALPPAVIRASPPTATDDAPPPRATAKRVAPPVAARDAPRTETDEAPPPKATAKRATPPAAAREAPSPKPVADHDGFTTSIDEEPAPTLPVSPRTAKRSKPMKESDSTARGPWADSPEDEQLRRKLTICRDCK